MAEEHAVAGRPSRTIADLVAGDHLCCLYETEGELRAVLTPFLRHGLDRGEKVVSIADGHAAETILGYLRDDGVDTASCEARGQLVSLSVDEMYLRGGTFEPADMIARLRAETAHAVADGYPALRVTGEMSWALRGMPGSERLAEYEAQVNECLSGIRSLALCQYDRRRFAPAVLLDILRTHPHVVIGSEICDNPYYLPPADLVSHDRSASDLRRWMRNLTDRQRAQCNLRESDARYRRILAGLTDYQYTVRVEHGRAVETTQSPACVTVTGYTAEEFAADPYLWIHMVVPEDRGLVTERVQQTLAGKTIPPLEHRIVRKDGDVRWVCDTIILFKDDSGTLRSYDGVIKDITEHRRAEGIQREFEVRNQHLQKAESLGRMAGAVAHHFNNLLGAVLGNLELALDDLPRDAGPAEHVTEAILAARRAAEVSGLMLTYLGQSFGTRERLDLAATCRRLLPGLRSGIPPAIGLSTDAPTPGPAILANAHQLRQMLTNLLTNAVEAMGDRSGTIDVAIGMASSGELAEAHRFPVDWVPATQEYARLTVSDTGCGIEAADIERLFDPFYSTKFTGRGLGLPVVLGIARAHGGAVTVESELGRGSCFRVFFPVCTDKEPGLVDAAARVAALAGARPSVMPVPVAAPCASSDAMATPKSVSAGPRASGMAVVGTVLLIENEPMVRKLAATMLRRLGFVVVEARDGVEGVSVFRQHMDNIRVVLCDLTMPRMNGWETVAALRAISPAIPVVLASGYDEARVMDGDHPAWPGAFLNKPYRLHALRDAIEHAVQAGAAGPPK